MYTRTIQNDESGGAQSFRRGSHNIPASYSGNVFFTDFKPEEESAEPMPEEACESPAPPEPPAMPEPQEPKEPPASDKKEPRTLALDDLLLIGLILLLSHDRERSSTETLILLGILFLTGF